MIFNTLITFQNCISNSTHLHKFQLQFKFEIQKLPHNPWTNGLTQLFSTQGTNLTQSRPPRLPEVPVINQCPIYISSKPKKRSKWFFYLNLCTKCFTEKIGWNDYTSKIRLVLLLLVVCTTHLFLVPAQFKELAVAQIFTDHWWSAS